MRKTIATIAITAVAIIVPGISTAEAAPQSVWTNNAARNAIIMRESGGNPYAVNKSSGARGLYQCLPSVHSCPSVGDVSGQHKWGNQYAMGRYGSWEAAWRFWSQNGWW